MEHARFKMSKHFLYYFACDRNILVIFELSCNNDRQRLIVKLTHICFKDWENGGNYGQYVNLKNLHTIIRKLFNTLQRKWGYNNQIRLKKLQ